MGLLLNILSFVASFSVALMTLYLVQDFTVGRIPALRKIVIADKVFFKDIVFIGVAIYIILNHFDFYLPYK